MRYSVAMSTAINQQVVGHLLRKDGQEDLCFALWYPSYGKTRTTALIHRVLLPIDGERKVHGNVSFKPSYFERVIKEAIGAKAGIALLHSHLGPGWQDMSIDDINAEQGNAARVKGATGLPIIGLTYGTDGAWSARFWQKSGPGEYTRQWCETVRVVGNRLDVTYMNELLPISKFHSVLERTISAWGPIVQANLSRLRIGIVGAGSVGSIVAESLGRMGVQRVKLIDFDSVETVNIDRLLHASLRDAKLQRAKVDVVARGVKRGATAEGFNIETIEYSVTEDQGFREALDCDVIFCCVDRPWPRSVLNFIAYAHLIPIIDGGIRIERSKKGTLRRADWRAHIACPSRKCLECLGQYDPGLVSAERDGYFDDPTYIAGLPENHPIRANENVFGFSLSVAAFEVLQMLTMIIAPLDLPNPGAQMYHFVPGTLDIDKSCCSKNCLYHSMTALGEQSGIKVTGYHAQAETARSKRKALKKSWRYRIADLIDRLIY